MFELLGVTGIAISVLAYLPQVVHLAREHCSAGVSSRAWSMWLLSSLLIGALALHRHDLVFVLLQISSLTSAAIILFLAQRYRGMVCEAHARGYPRCSPRRRRATRRCCRPVPDRPRAVIVPMPRARSARTRRSPVIDPRRNRLTPRPASRLGDRVGRSVSARPSRPCTSSCRGRGTRCSGR